MQQAKLENRRLKMLELVFGKDAIGFLKAATGDSESCNRRFGKLLPVIKKDANELNRSWNRRLKMLELVIGKDATGS